MQSVAKVAHSIFYLILLFLVFSCIGLGWSNGFLRQFQKKLGFGAFALPASIGIAVVACAAVIDFAYFGSQTFLRAVVVITTCLGMIHTRNRQLLRMRPRKFGKISAKKLGNSKFLWLIPVGLMVAVIPNVGAEGRLTVANRVGPDAVSYLLNTRVIYNQEKLGEIKKRIELGSSKSMSQLTNPNNFQMYSLTSWNDQIAAGFIFDALRWAPSALIASVLRLPGFRFTDLFEISSLILALCALLGSILLGGYVGKKSKNQLLGVLGCLTFLLCPITLFNWHEGFWLQILAMPYLAILAISMFDVKNIDLNQSSGQITVAFLGIVLFYPDLLIVYVPLIIGVITLHFVRLREIPSNKFIQFWIRGITTSLLLAFPLTIRLPEMVISRLIQSSTSGFWLPSWGSIWEILGIQNRFLSDQIFESIANSSSEVSSWILVCNSLLILLIIIGLFRSFHKSDLEVDILTICLLALLMTFWKVHAEGSPNYQFIKLQGYLLPLFLLLLMSALCHVYIRHPRLVQAYVRTWLLFLICVAIQFGFDFKQSISTTHLYDKNKMGLFDDVNAQNAFEKYNIIYSGSNVAVMGEIASAQNVNWINRDFGGLETNFTDRIPNPLALIVSDSELQWGCINFLRNDVVFLSRDAGVALILIAPSSVAALTLVDARSVVSNYLSANSITFEDLLGGCELES